jgi:hypothetical protein
MAGFVLASVAVLPSMAPLPRAATASSLGSRMGSGQALRFLEKIDSDVRDGKMRMIVAYGDSYLDPDRLDAQRRSLGEPGSVAGHVFTILAYQDEGSEERMTAVTAIHGVTFNGWRRLYRQVATDVPSKGARLVSMVSGTVVQTDDAGRLATRVTEGQNPLLLSVQDIQLEILEIRFYRLPHPVPPTQDGSNPQLMELWVKASRLPSLAEGRLVLSALQRKFDNPRIAVWLREDGWFVFSSSLVWFPFNVSGEPPTWAAFRRNKEMGCTAQFESSPRCSYRTLDSPGQSY